ncbi:MAG: N-acyl amino acid synthase FeeM domain-containing protein [Halodesulfovibrio sp.]
MGTDIERRRTIRIRRSSLANNNLMDIDRPSIKIAEDKDDYSEAFRIVYDAYAELGYTSQHHTGMYYNIFSMLPTTCVFVFKQYLKPISTLTQVLDSDLFGLPMDKLYKKEVDELRNQGRKIAEIGALATSKESRWNNLLMFLGKAYFQYAKLIGINDILITVNPKHVEFYKAIFLFEPFAEERHHPSVGAPAVALRINYDQFWERLEYTFRDHEFETDLYTFFSKIHNSGIDASMRFNLERNIPIPEEAANYYFMNRPEMLQSLNPAQIAYLRQYYKDAICYSH